MDIKNIDNRADRRLSALLVLLAGGVALLLALIMLLLLNESWPFIAKGWREGTWLGLFQNQGWYPLEGRFGMAPMIWASLAVTLGAIVLALPIGLAYAVFLQFYAPTATALGFRLLLNLLAGVPSVVFGLWGLTRLVPWIAQWQPPGASLLAAILVLSLMILPTVALTSAAALAAVPKELISGAMALGLRRKTQILYVVIPAARSGIASGTLLATARALGETMAVLMVAGNVVQTPSGLFEPVRVLTANIALEMAYAMGDHRASLFASGLLLTLLVWLLSWIAHRVTRITKEKRQHV
ncbi:phosphate ABC transporter membrane protein 1, PhoT family [Nitrosomonas cryotolerans]|uniref:Phosphate transport system permease protein n=1 Tax=Nitrosomonas cryotolerans ATCC 49181 TaxID=1131553 RepID=A0A1N6I8U3_9PROT|nr:phosphate ABC transporter permease subunit PstC [Nitrosomonas cryotolerans]SFP83165.1 phosphate ABC transporter membrane protein 1, PhoT family [Nitrosomonas cryotolerans]SIO28436.1 phosphate ABC transporter membrane protein 1, PhoT family [Nitrosomonas cryotolerans ATCC 49181]